MNIHEHQGKAILRKYGIATPGGFPCFTVDDAVQAAGKLGGQKWAVKAQIHAGGRGKGGGVRIAQSQEEVRKTADRLLGSSLVTGQTRPHGRIVRRLLVEEAVDIDKEFYIAVAVDQTSQLPLLIASSEGGMDVEEVAARMPDRLFTVSIDPVAGLTDGEADSVARRLGMPEGSWLDARTCMQGLCQAFDQCDATLAEINPLALTGDGRLIALDVKFSFDDNALFRHPELLALRDAGEEDDAETEAAAHGLAYISLDGNIGCLVNGAGLAMATMDAIKLYGGSPANFLDVGGGATTENVAEAFKLMLRNPGLKAILVNIFGGIMRCDVVAQGIVEAACQVGLRVPLVVRMKGANERAGRKILLESGLPLLTANNMDDAAEKVVNATKRG